MYNAATIRKKFLDFFESKGHKIVQSAPIVVKDDPTLMFTNAGMNQFKDLFLGNKEPQYSRIADTQKCLRVSGKHNDLEEVGVDTYHHTMFEMLGNWSFGDYFKADSIAWAWEFLTGVLGIEKDRLYVTVFEGDSSEGLAFDQEAWNEWKKHIDEDRILKGNKKDNFWEMGDTGPCGPCSEIHVDARSNEDRKLVDGKELVNASHPEVIEVWNLVFMQFNRKADQSLESLPAQHVDTGMGFERLVRIIQGKTSNYDSDIFQPIIRKTETLSGIAYGSDEKSDIAFRVIADHIRAVAFCIADGQLPSNNGAGYVVRRILRRAVRYGYSFLGFRSPFFNELVSVLSAEMADAFPELHQQAQLVQRVIQEEESTFLRTLENGLRKLQDVTETLSSNKTYMIPGNIVFELYDTYGFPYDLTSLLAREQGFSIDEAGYQIALEEQKNRSRQAAVSEAGDWMVVKEQKDVVFTGYENTEGTANIIRMREVKQKNKTMYQVVLDRTPFYAESGGQIGDTGTLTIDHQTIQVLDTRKENDLIIHLVDRLPENPNAPVFARIDDGRRLEISRNHSATHLVHAALRRVLGTHVQQKGSYVGPDRLRFDFSHFSKMTAEELERVETMVNEKILQNISLDERRHVPIEEAKTLGAMMLFGEKYGEEVRVITFDEHYSRELCGGIHVPATGHIGPFKIISETAVAAGIRRIEAITGHAARKLAETNIQIVHHLEELLKSRDVVQSVQQLLDEQSQLKKEMEKYQLAGLQTMLESLQKNAANMKGVTVITGKVEVANAELLKKLAYDLRHANPELFAVLGAEVDGKAILAVMISDGVVSGHQLHAGNIVKELGRYIEGGGGGQAHFATAGGKKPEGLTAALEAAKGYIKD
jgi:alanyl-tRNA synthetase